MRTEDLTVAEVPGVTVGGGTLRVQVDGLETPALHDAGPADLLRDRMRATLDELGGMLAAVQAQVDRARPDETCVEFGVAVDGRGGILVFQGSGHVHFTVKLTWKKATESAPVEPVPPAGAAGPAGTAAP